MKKIVLVMALFCAAVGHGAYQYIISTDSTLAVNPKQDAYSGAISLNVRTASAGANVSAALETRYRTATPAGFSGSKFYRTNQGFHIVIH